MIESFALGATLPVLLPLLAALLVLVLDLVRPLPAVAHVGVGGAGLLGGAVAALSGIGSTRGAFCVTPQVPGADVIDRACLYVVGPVESGLQAFGLLTALAVLALALPDWQRRPRDGAPVLLTLLLVATAGAVALPAARDVGTWWIGLELATLPAVALIALHRRRTDEARGIEGAVALLTTSLVSFGLLALGGALWYLASGSALLTGDAAVEAVAAGNRPVLMLAVLFGIAGLAFKLSLAPFHAWTPTAYTGAPLPVAAFLAATSKVAALAGLLVLVRAIAPLGESPLQVLAALAVLSMTLGNVLALRQREPVRLLAWSAVAQAGWVALPLAALGPESLPAAAGYLVVYGTATLVAFAVVAAVRHHREGLGAVLARPEGYLGEHAGLLRSRPWLGLPLAFALLTLAGLPPAVAGLVAKIMALAPVAGAALWWAAVLAALNIAIGLVVYLRWVFVLARPASAPEVAEDATTRAEVDEDAPAADEDAVDVAPERPWHPAYLVVAWVGTAALVVGSVAPGLLLGLVSGS